MTRAWEPNAIGSIVPPFGGARNGGGCRCRVRAGAAAETLSAQDACAIILAPADGMVVTVPTGLTPCLEVTYVQTGAGQVVIQAGAGETLLFPPGYNPASDGPGTTVTVTTLTSTQALVAGDPSLEPAFFTGLRFDAGQYAFGTAGQYANPYVRMRVAWAPLTQALNSFTCIAGTNGGAGLGIVLSTSNPGGYPQGSIKGFDAVAPYSTPAAFPEHIMLPGELGRYIVDDLWLSGGLLYHARMGRLVRPPVADALASWTSGNAFAVNCRPTVPGTLQYGSLIIFDIQYCTVAPTLAEVRADALKRPGVAVAGALNHWVGEDVTSGLGNWVDRVSGRVLALTGVPSVRAQVPASYKSVGAISLFSDSEAVRESPGVSGNSWKRLHQEAIVGGGAAYTGLGKFAAGGASTLDYDNRCSATSSQALGLANGATPSALSTLGADLPLYVTADGSFILSYGANDCFVRIVTNGEAPATAAAAYLADLDTALTLIGAYMEAGRPILITNIMRESTGTTSANQRSFIDLVNAALPAWIATRRVTYPGLRLADVCAAVTPTQAAADNVAVLYDGLHLAAAVRAAYAQAVAAQLLDAA